MKTIPTDSEFLDLRLRCLVKVDAREAHFGDGSVLNRSAVGSEITLYSVPKPAGRDAVRRSSDTSRAHDLEPLEVDARLVYETAAALRMNRALRVKFMRISDEHLDTSSYLTPTDY